MTTLKETAKKFLAELVGDPQALAEVRDAIASLPPASSAPVAGRPEMPEDERRALGAEFIRRQGAFVKEGPRIEAARAELQKQRQALEEEEARLGAEESARHSGWTSWRDQVMARLWSLRPALVDELLARLEAEAVEVARGMSRFDMPLEALGDAGDNILINLGRSGEIITDTINSSSFGRTVSNSASVNVRRKALLNLAELLRDWTARGEYATTRELQQMFDKAYAALPQVTPLREVLRSDVRGYQFVQDARPLPGPPAA